MMVVLIMACQFAFFLVVFFVWEIIEDSAFKRSHCFGNRPGCRCQRASGDDPPPNVPHRYGP
jgi:hypothetical protein